MGIGGQLGQCAVSFHQTRGKLHSPLEFSGSEHLVASSSQQNSQLKMRRSMIWIQLQNLAESGFGLSGTIWRLRQGQAQLVMGLGEVGTERDRLLQLADRRAELTVLHVALGSLHQNHGASDIGGSLIEFFQLGQLLLGLFFLAGFLQSLRQAGMGLREIRIKADSATELLDGSSHVVQFEQHCSQNVMAFGIVRALGHGQAKFGRRSG